MAKSFECRHAGVLCGARITGDTDEEVLTKAIAHAREAHGVDLSKSKTLIRYAQTAIREEGPGSGEPRGEEGPGAEEGGGGAPGAAALGLAPAWFVDWAIGVVGVVAAAALLLTLIALGRRIARQADDAVDALNGAHRNTMALYELSRTNLALDRIARGLHAVREERSR